MLSEALCSRARSVSERRGHKKTRVGDPASLNGASSLAEGVSSTAPAEEEDEIPFARRAREQGKSFRGGKMDGESFRRLGLRQE